MTFLQKHRRDLLFTLALLVLAGGIYLATHTGKAGTVAVLQ